MQTKLPQSLDNPVSFILLGAFAGFLVGRLTASVSTARYLKAAVSQSGESTEKPKSEYQTKGKARATADDEDIETEDELQEFESLGEECKLVLVVRTDLGMTKGKIAAQCGHATLACYKALANQEAQSNKPHSLLKRWERWGQAKVAVRVNSLDELLTLQAQAMSLGLCAKVIHDAGRTQIAGGSATVLGVGPGPKSVVDQVTGGLKLL